MLLADDVGGKCSSVHTSPLATVLFVSPWRPLNSSGNDVVIKYITNMPTRKSSVTVAGRGASSILVLSCAARLIYFFLQPAAIVAPCTSATFFWDATYNPSMTRQTIKLIVIVINVSDRTGLLENSVVTSVLIDSPKLRV